MDELARQWGQNIARGRELLGLSQRELGELVGVAQPSVARWESGENTPRDHHKAKLAQALKQDVRSLFPLVAGVA